MYDSQIARERAAWLAPGVTTVNNELTFGGPVS